jgi:hypothetical protein
MSHEAIFATTCNTISVPDVAIYSAVQTSGFSRPAPEKKIRLGGKNDSSLQHK